MNKLVFIRHGETVINEKGLTHKTNDQTQLSIQGIKQIKATAKALRNLKIEKIICSNEKRTVESASIINELINLTFETTPDLKERNWGLFEGKPWSEIKATLDNLTLAERYIFIPPQGESWQDFEVRISKAIKELVSENTNKNIAIITHGGVIRALIPSLLNLAKEQSFKYDPDNGSITIVNYNKGKYSIEIINDTKHLT